MVFAEFVGSLSNDAAFAVKMPIEKILIISSDIVEIFIMFFILLKLIID